MMKNAGEKAMALVDGQLAPGDVPELVRELARSPALVAELQAYLATAGRRIGGPFEAKLGEPVPGWLIDTVERAPQAPGRPLWPLRRWALLEHLTKGHRVPAWSLAAGPALAALLVALVAWSVVPASSQGGPIQGPLRVALDKTQSGKDAPLAALRPVLSFKSKAAAWCRQYELRYATRQVSHGLACRDDGGRWNIVASTRPRAIGLAPAGSEPRKAIDDLVTSMISGRPLSDADETSRIGTGWSRQ
jgi:hypothetical protein